MKAVLLAIGLSLALGAPFPARADAQSQVPLREDLERARDEAERLWREGQQKIIEGVERLIESVPSYEAPEVTEDGDIIIRRRRDPAPQDAPAPAEPPDEPDKPDEPDDEETGPKDI